MTTFSVQNFGCRVNQAEAFLWAEELGRRGWRLERDFLQSDFIIVNTCTLTARADRDIRKFIRKAARENPQAKLILTGCFVERAREELERLSGGALLLSNGEKEGLAESLLSLAGEERREVGEGFPFRTRAFLKIQDGCDFRCTFCIVPTVRGRSRSVPVERILQRMEQLADRGFKEVVLAGIHLCSYGVDLTPPSSLLELLLKSENRRLPFRIRLSSLDPRFLNREFLEYLVSSSRVCPHFHLSLQSGSDTLLARMGRKSRTEGYESLLTFLRSRLPDASLGADIMVGFGGETEKDFWDTFRFLERSPLTSFHVFSYSPRPGTPAASWPVESPRVVRERAASLRRLSQRKSLEFRSRFLGREMEALLIQRKKKGGECLTSNGLCVFLPEALTEHEKIPQGGDVLKIRITSVDSRRTYGLLAS